MQFINKITRETVTFDASNKQHREYFRKFIENSSWKDCPVIFMVEKPYISVVDMIKDKLIAHFLVSDKHLA